MSLKKHYKLKPLIALSLCIFFKSTFSYAVTVVGPCSGTNYLCQAAASTTTDVEVTIAATQYCTEVTTGAKAVFVPYKTLLEFQIFTGNPPSGVTTTACTTGTGTRASMVRFTADGTWTVPTGITTANFYLWGAGGGNGGTSPATPGSGGAGGYVNLSAYAVTPATVYHIAIGVLGDSGLTSNGLGGANTSGAPASPYEAGGNGGNASAGSNGYGTGAGGAGGTAFSTGTAGGTGKYGGAGGGDSSVHPGGGGGGATEVFTGSSGSGTDVFVAGGGGGGGGAKSAGIGGNGGAGCGSIGTAGTGSAGDDAGGGGGGGACTGPAGFSQAPATNSQTITPSGNPGQYGATLANCGKGGAGGTPGATNNGNNGCVVITYP